MKLLSAQQIRQWDQFTIEHEPISSLELMERAAKASTRWLLQNILGETFYVFCGKGNNGGDGLAIARMLQEAGKKVRIYILETGATGSEDFLINFNHVHQAARIPITLLREEKDFPRIPPGTFVIDALFGTGLTRKLEGLATELAVHLNESTNAVVSIDIPSGLFCDASSRDNVIIAARHTLTFQALKMAFLIPENEPWFGQVHILDINLHPDFPESVDSRFNLINKPFCQSVYRSRRSFAHKGDFGHALIVAGSYGKAGAAVLSARACIRSGVGLLTVQVPGKLVPVLQTAVPEAMCIADKDEKIISTMDAELLLYKSAGIGPGIGTGKPTANYLHDFLKHYRRPIVIDADAINILARHPEWLPLVPPFSILTPHPKEFERLFGATANDFEKISLALDNAQKLQLVIILKGHYSFVALPDGTGYFNITGNAGMATGGSGDVLTGILTGLLAQGYQPADAARLGVFLHGLAGDFAAGKYSMEAMTAGDIIGELGNAFKAISV
jgi:NAD(P)H-hydrate epimerase